MLLKLRRIPARGLTMAGMVLLLMISAATHSQAQRWQSAYDYYGQEIGRSVLLLSDNSVVVVGETAGNYTPTDTDIYLMWHGGCNNGTWNAFAYDIGGRDQAARIRATADGGYIIVGTTENTLEPCDGNLNQIFLLKLDAVGAINWMYTYGSSGVEEGYDVQVVPDGYIVVGSTTSYNFTSREALIMKVSLAGLPIWAKAYGGPGDELLRSCTIATNNDIFAVGHTSSFTSSNKIFGVRVDQATGNLIAGYPKWYGSIRDDFGWSVVADALGDFVIAGNTYSYSLSLNSEAMLLRLNSSGAPVKMVTVSGRAQDEFRELVKYGTDQYLVTGFLYRPQNGWGNFDMFVGVYDPLFNPVMTMIHGGSGAEQGLGIATNPDVSDNIVATGLMTSYVSNPNDLYLVRQDLSGSGCYDREPLLFTETVSLAHNNAPVTVTPLSIFPCGRKVIRYYVINSRYVFCNTCVFGQSSISSGSGLGNDTDRKLERMTDSAGTLVALAATPDSETEPALNIYPNPIAGKQMLILEHQPVADAAMQVAVIDMSGRVISQREYSAATSRLEISTEGWAAGTYVMQVKIGEKTQARRITVLDK